MKIRQESSEISASLPVRGAWIEILSRAPRLSPTPSLPVRGAWIEMRAGRAESYPVRVAPRAGSVD